MSDYVLVILIVLAAFFIIRRFVEVKTFKSEEEYLKYKEEQDLLDENSEDELEELVDKNTYKFLTAGLLATILFLIFGFFTDNVLYLYIMLFIITAILFVFCFPPTDKF